MAAAISQPSVNMAIQLTELILNPFKLDGEEDLIREAQGLVDDVVQRLKPNLKYVVKPVTYLDSNSCEHCDHPALLDENKIRAIVIFDPNENRDGQDGVLLTEEGVFIRVMRCKGFGRIHRWQGTTMTRDGIVLTWHFLRFDQFFDLLTKAYEVAEQLKKDHWEAVKAKTDLLQRVRASLRGEVVPQQ